MCFDGIGLHAQNMLTILGHAINMIGGGGLYDHLLNTRISTLIMDKMFKQAPKAKRQMAMDMIWIC